MVNRGPLRLAAALAAALTLSASVLAAGAQPLHPLADKSRDASSLDAAVASGGTVRVIVELETATSPDFSRATDATRAAAVSQAATSFVSGFLAERGRAPAGPIRSASRIPVVSMVADAADLEILAADPQVKAVHMDRPSRRTLDTSVPLIGMNEVYADGASGSDVIVAVLDTGVDGSHAFLSGKIVGGACYSSTMSSGGYSSVTVCPNGQESQTGTGAGEDCSVASYGPGCQHGTHVAGIVAGSKATAGPRNGVAKSASILPIQVFSYFSAFGDVMSWQSDQILALDYVYAQRNAFPGKTIGAVNMSLGGGSYTSTCPDHPLRSAVQLLRNVGIAVVAAAGNDGATNAMGGPACIPEAVSVGSTTKTDQISSFSNMSAQTTLLAPGSSILSSVPGGSYATFSGTSMATPHAAGAIAVLKGAFPAKTVSEIVTALVDTGLPIADEVHTKNRIRVERAYDALSGGSTDPVLPGTLIADDTSPVEIIRVGKSISPSSFTVGLTASSGTVNWSLSGLPRWLKASRTSGTAGTAGTSVTFSVVSNRASKSDSATLVFRNTSTSQPAIEIPVRLLVQSKVLSLQALNSRTVKWTGRRKVQPAQIRTEVSTNYGTAQYRVSRLPKWLRLTTRDTLVDRNGALMAFEVVPPANQKRRLTARVKVEIPGVKGSTKWVKVTLEPPPRRYRKSSGPS